MKKIAILLFATALLSSAYSSDGNKLIKPVDVSIEQISQLLEDAFYNIKSNAESILINDENLTSVIALNKKEYIISLYSFFQVSENPMGNQRSQIIQSIINEWSNQKILLRIYVSSDKKSIITDYHVSFKAGITGSQILDIYSRYKAMVNAFSYDCGKSISDSVISDVSSFMNPTKETVFAYIEYVLNPTMIEVGNSVRLENDDIIIIHKPNLEYSIVDKKTGKIENGMHGFNTNASDFSKAMVYYFECQPMSVSDFLEKSNYAENSKTIVVPVSCSKDEVTYKYIKPDSESGKLVSFKITEIKK